MIDFDAVIFDLDGTIADSNYVWEKIDVDFFGKRGLDVPEDYLRKIDSLSFNDAAVFTKNEYGFSESTDEIKAEWCAMAKDEYSFKVKPKKYAGEYIKKIKENGAKIALCTASPKELYEPFLKNNGMYSYFDVFVSGTEVKRGKAFPDIYLLAAERLGVPPKRCVVFEDILSAVLGAKSAGMTVYGIADFKSERHKEKIMEAADGFIYDFSEIM